MPLEFRPPNLPLQGYDPEALPRTLDQLFNAYLAIQQNQRSERLQGAQLESANLQGLAAKADLARGGVDPTAYNPNDPESVKGFFAPLLEQGRAARALAERKGAADVSEAEASADLKRSQAGLADTLASQGGKGALKGSEVNRLLGADLFPPDATVSPAQQALARTKFSAENKPLGVDAASRKTMAEDALENLADIETALESPTARELMLKAGGSFNKLKSLGDPEAEKLANAIFQAGDAEARVKTGAAINETEMQNYFRDLVRSLGTVEGTKDRIARKKRFFEKAITNISAVRSDLEKTANPTRAKPDSSSRESSQDLIRRLSSEGKSKEGIKAALKAAGY